jgi:hypothetical protein
MNWVVCMRSTSTMYDALPSTFSFTATVVVCTPAPLVSGTGAAADGAKAYGPSRSLRKKNNDSAPAGRMYVKTSSLIVAPTGTGSGAMRPAPLATTVVPDDAVTNRPLVVSL